MRIFFVIDNLSSGGAQRLLINTAEGLSKKHQTRIILYNSKLDFYSGQIKNIPIKNLITKKSKGFSIRKVFALRREIKNADLVISYMPRSSIYVFLSNIFLKKKYHIAVEVSVLNKAESHLKRFLVNFTYLFVDHIVCNNNIQAKSLSKNIFLGNKVSIIWNGCKKLNFVNRKKRKNELINFIVVGRVAYPKNGLRFLKSLKIFYEKYKFLPNIKWIGRRDYSDKFNLKINQEMDSFLNKNPIISEKFSFIGEKQDIEKEYTNADAIILPSIFEGYPPFVICEAMLNGCPVIASQISDYDIVLGKKGERGITFNPYSLEDMANSLNKFIKLTQKEVDIMTLNARKFAERHLMIDNMVSSYNGIINKYEG